MSVSTVIITSPPYWNLRSYEDNNKKLEGQLGLEPDWRDYLSKMHDIMEECKRVLKKTGTAWINISEPYNSAKSGHPSSTAIISKKTHRAATMKRPTVKNIQEKSKLGIHMRFAIDCIDSGWILRNEIPWVKRNHLPSSVRDRLTNTWEPVFFFARNNKILFWTNQKTGQLVTKKPPTPAEGVEGIDWVWRGESPESTDGPEEQEQEPPKLSLWSGHHYYFNLNAIRIPPKTKMAKPFNIRVRDAKRGLVQQKLLGGVSDEEYETHNKRGEKIIHEKYADNKDMNTARLHRDRPGNPNKQDSTLGADGKPIGTYKGFNERWRERKWNEVSGQTTQSIARKHSGEYDMETGESLNHPAGKNPGDVITLTTEPFPEAHFATFPTSLPLWILKAACPQQVCIECHMPRYPISAPTEEYQQQLKKCHGLERGGIKKAGYATFKSQLKRQTSQYQTIGYSRCECNAPFRPGVVLDPFLGSGTTAIAAEKLGLHWCGIELSQQYIDIARKRLKPYRNERLMEVWS